MGWSAHLSDLEINAELLGAVSTWKGKTDVPTRLWIGIDAAPVNIEVVVVHEPSMNQSGIELHGPGQHLVTTGTFQL